MTIKKSRRIYVIGAGFAGRSLASQIRSKAIFGEVVAFLDDDGEKIGRSIDGVPVLGPIRDVARLLRMNPADEAIIAIPGASREYLKELYSILKKAGFEKISILPGIAQIIEGDAHLVQTRSIDPQDLLGRTPVAIQLKQSLAYLRGKRVMVTGAGGSIGGELCRQLLSAGVSRLYLFGHGENSIYEIDRELRLLRSGGVGETTSVVPVIGDLKDADYVGHIVARLRADVVFHAAAYKHVPLMEENPVAAIENNVFGTENLLRAAMRSGTRRFVHVTTDKAVDPVSVYGASKLICERLVMEAAIAAADGGAREAGAQPCGFMAVRFGNVLGSRGSIVPLFQKQIGMGGPVTVTHPEARRWFMTIPEACSLVLKAGGVGENGNLYLLDMGDPVRIRDLAEQMIRFYGFEPEDDVRIEYCGLRKGERLDERLWSDDEEPRETEHSRILRVDRTRASEISLARLMEDLRPVCRFDPERPEAYRDDALLRSILRGAIPAMRCGDEAGAELQAEAAPAGAGA